MRRILTGIGCVAFIALAAPAMAQPEQVESLGEVPRVSAAFYECKPGPVVNGVRTWREVTTLMLLTPGPIPTVMALGFFDGHGNGLARSTVVLGAGDLDEINVCRTLEAAGFGPPPKAGAIVLLTISTTYCWMKNLLGKFLVTENEPFDGRVDGIAKTECRVVAPFALFGENTVARLLALPEVPPILIQDTAD